MIAFDVATCRVCGCTDDEACEGGCMWVEDPEGLGDICSSCVTASSPKREWGAGVLAGAGPHSTLCVGAVVQWRGQSWIITAAHNHPLVGRFFRLERPVDDAYDLVHVNGNDGALEALEPIA